MPDELIVTPTHPDPSTSLPRNSLYLCGFNEGIAELVCPVLHGPEDAFLVSLDVVIRAWIDVGSLVLDGEVDH